MRARRESSRATRHRRVNETGQGANTVDALVRRNYVEIGQIDIPEESPASISRQDSSSKPALHRIFSRKLPLLARHFARAGVLSELFVVDWSLTLFSRAMPLAALHGAPARQCQSRCRLPAALATAPRLLRSPRTVLSELRGGASTGECAVAVEARAGEVGTGRHRKTKKP